jgi:hypothetical protein
VPRSRPLARPFTRSLFPALTAALLAIPAMAAIDAPLAHADRGIHVSGGVRASGRVNVRVGGARIRPRRQVLYRRYEPRPVRFHMGGSVYWGGGIYVGPRFASPPPPPPPPPPDCACDVGYGYDQGYDQGYGYPPPPSQHVAAPPPVVVSAPPPVAELPRLGLGVYAGSVNIDNRTQGGELGLFGRLRLTEKVYVEAELAAAEMTDARLDNRLGAALLFDFSPRSRFSLNVLGGLGLTQSQTNETITDEKSYGELGLGLTYRPTPRFHIAADARVGQRTPVMDEFAKDSTPIEAENFSRGRLSAIVLF